MQSLAPGTFTQSPAQEEAGGVTQGRSGLLPVLDGDGAELRSALRARRGGEVTAESPGAQSAEPPDD